MQTREEKIQLALNDLDMKIFKNTREAGEAYGIEKSVLNRRMKKLTTSRKEAAPDS